MTDSNGLFGNIAVRLGFVSQEQLDLCLRVQAQLGGRHHLGSLMAHRGYLTEEQLEMVLALQQQQQAAAAQGAAEAAASQRVDAPPEAPSLRPAEAPHSSSAAVSAAQAPGPALDRSFARPAASAGASRISGLLEAAEKRNASDVHLHPGTPAALRIGGRLLVSSQPPLDARELTPQLHALLSEAQRTRLRDEQSLDALIVTPSGLRCRASFYETSSGLNATFRLIRRAPPTLAELGLPGSLASFVSHTQGLVLVTGLAGSGKTSTLAALTNLIAEERAEHVLSLEDPIEIVHPAKKALVNQRQVGRDTGSFSRALRAALREDPDVIVLGELRDRETIALAVTAAETGHLVIGSMNTASSSRAISRILGAFPPAQQAQVRAMVSESLRGVITQRLVPTLDGGRAAALEILVVTPAIANLIRDDKLFQIRSQLQTGRAAGMRALDESLRELVLAGRVAPEEAKLLADNPALIPAAPSSPPRPPGAAAPAPRPTGAAPPSPRPPGRKP
jgi:twitching motility protein PilT